MTRDEAIKICQRATDWASAEALVETLEALGVLKLDEPRSSPEALLCTVLHSVGVHGLAQRAVIDGITSAGLKIVDK